MRLSDSAYYVDDRAALRRYARSGDPESFAVLAARYQSMVMATCLRVLGNESDAEDAAQETFVRLAEHAGKIRSNTAAWLHACAMGVSVDLVRRAVSRRRAERAAVERRSDAAAVAGDPGAMERWRQIEPDIDRALAALAEVDRDLIVARYLAGRAQVEIAREHGVSEGTVSRRLKRALQRLRAELEARGVAVGAAAGLSAALAMGSGVAVSESLASSIGKIGLSGLARGGRDAGPWALRLGVSAAVVGVTVLGFLAASVVTRPAGVPGVSGRGAVGGASAVAPARPSSPIGPFQMVTAADETFDYRGLWVTERGLSIRMGAMQDGELRQTSLRVRSIEKLPDDPETTDREERALIEASVTQILPLGDEWARFRGVGRISIVCSFDTFGRIVLEDRDGNVQIGRNEPRWYGVRPPYGWPEYGRIPEDAGAFGILGPWTESERIPVTVSAEEIHFGTDTWSAVRYRVIDWERRDGYSRVLSVNAGGRDPRMIGTRFRLLIREDLDGSGEREGYTIAFYPPESSRAKTEWPSGFEYSASNPVRVVSFAGGG